MEKYIPFKTQKELSLIPIDEILYITQLKRKLKIVTKSRTYVEYEKIGNLDSYLNEDFFHSLKYTYVNLNEICGFLEQKIIFKNGEVLGLGRDSFNRTKKRFIEYLYEKSSVIKK